MKHRYFLRVMSLICLAALLLGLGACSPVETVTGVVKGWFGGKWVDDKPYESYKLSSYIKLGEYKGVDPALPEGGAEGMAKRYFDGRFMGVVDDPAKTAVAKGDIVLFSYEGSGEGISAETLRSMYHSGYILEVGSGEFVKAYKDKDGVERRPSFEDQMIGQKRGVEFNVNVIFPDQYGEEGFELNGKPVTFKCKIAKIGKASEKIMDEGVLMLTGGQLKTAQELLNWAQDDMREQAFEAAYILSETLKIPEKEQAYWDTQLEKDAKDNGAGSADEYVSYYFNASDAASYRDEQIKREMFAFSVAEKEGLAVTNEEVKAELDKHRAAAGDTGTDAELYSKYGGKGRLIRELMMVKAGAFILENVK